VFGRIMSMHYKMEVSGRTMLLARQLRGSDSLNV
jgi:hypothetical protein